MYMSGNKSISYTIHVVHSCYMLKYRYKVYENFMFAYSSPALHDFILIWHIHVIWLFLKEQGFVYHWEVSGYEKHNIKIDS